FLAAHGLPRPVGADELLALARTLPLTRPVESADLAKFLAERSPVLPRVAADQTGVGRAVMEMVRDADLAAELRPVLITAGHQTTFEDDGSYHVPKKELVSVLQVLLQSRRLKISPELPLASVLEQEFIHFKVKVTAAGNETFEAWRERDHDDLV